MQSQPNCSPATPTDPQPRILCDVATYQKIAALVRVCPAEINGFGVVHREGMVFTITGAFILAQEATFGHVETDNAALHKCIYEFAKEGNDPSTLGLQWHSHYTMPVFWSTTDIHNINRWLAMGGHLVSMVQNRYGEVLCRVDLSTPTRTVFNNIPLEFFGAPFTGAVPKPSFRQIVEASLEVRKKVRLAKECKLQTRATRRVQRWYSKQLFYCRIAKRLLVRLLDVRRY